MLRRYTLIGIGLAVGALSLAPLSTASAQDSESPAEKAAREIQAARDRANEAAGAYFEAESQIDQLEVRRQRLEREREQLAADVTALEDDVSALAVEQFVAASGGGMPLLGDPNHPSEQRHAQVLREVAIDASAGDLDAYDEARRKLDEKDAEIAATTEELEAAKETHLALQQQAEAEVEHLQEVEEQRLKDEAVQRELERQRAERQRQMEEEQRRQQEARQREQEEARDEAEQPSPAPAPDTSPVPTTPAPDTSPVPTAPGTDPPAPQPIQQPSPPAPAPAPAPEPEPEPPPDPFVGGLVCPVRGATAYSDTFGAPRSGGRAHEGVDMMAAEGTPVVAVTSGYVELGGSSLGGNSARLHGDNGDYYFYAHLSAYEGSSRDAGQGEVIGYVGHTGNTTVNHLHFEIHPGGGAAVNPYPTVVAAGC